MQVWAELTQAWWRLGDRLGLGIRPLVLKVERLLTKAPDGCDISYCPCAASLSEHICVCGIGELR